MILELILWVMLLILSSFASASLTYSLWWVTGQPQSLGNGEGDYVRGRIFSQIGRRLVDWYGRWEKKELLRLKQIALNILVDDLEDDKAFAKIFAKVDREQRRANPSKAFGVCPVCMGTYISLLISIPIIVIGGIYYSIWFIYLSPALVVYHWAISLSFLHKVHLA